MIRNKFYKEISHIIDKHIRFDSTDFSFEIVSERNSTTLTINYSIDNQYYILFKIPNTATIDKDGYDPYYAFTGTVCPGPLAYNETFTFKGQPGVYTRISTWLDSIWEEISSNPVIKQLETQQKQVDEIFEKFESIKDEYFTNNEANDLKERLDNLEETLKSYIQQSITDKETFEAQAEKLHDDIDTLKQTISSLNKKGWLRSFTGKVFKWTNNSENRKTLKDGYSMIKEYLPEDIKNLLP